MLLVNAKNSYHCLLCNNKQKRLFVFGLFIFSLSFLSALFCAVKPALAWTSAQCMERARSAIGSSYVDANYDTFKERCDSSTGSSGTYGMIFIYSSSIPEISNDNSFSKPLRRTTISTCTNCTANAYVCTSATGITMSDNMSATTASTSGQFAPAQGDGTITINPGAISWSNSSGTYKYRFEYTSCLNSSTCKSSCHTFPMIVYVHKVSYPSSTDSIDSVTGATKQSNGKYKVTSENGSVTVKFHHDLKTNKYWDISTTSGLWKYCTVQALKANASSADCVIPTGDNPTKKPTYTTTVAEGSEIEVCSWAKFPKKLGLGGYNPGSGHKWSGGVCVKIYREDPPTYTAAVSGSLSVGAPGSTTLISGTSYLGSYGTADYSATATKKLERTDSESNISTIAASGKAQTSSSSTGTFTDRSGATISGNLTRTGTTKSVSNTHTVPISSVGIGSSKTVCERLAYYASPTVKAGVQSNGSYSYTTPACVTVYRPARATFSGAVATPVADNDSNLSTITDGLLGNGSATSYKVKTTYTLTRTNDNPESAKTKYTTSNSSQPTTAGTLSNALKKGETQNPTANNTKTLTVNIGTKATQCFYLTYEKAIDYYGGTNRLNDIYTLDKTSSCIDIYNPQYATFSGDIKVTSTTMTGNDTNGFRGNGYDTTYTATPNFIVTRTNNTPETASSRYRYYIDNPTSTNATFDASKYPATTATPAQTASNKKNGEKATLPVDIEFSVPNGATRKKCFYLGYDNKVGYIDGSIFSSARYFNGKKYKCVDFYNPIKYTATFTASIRVTNGTYLVDNTDVTDGKKGNGLRSRFTLTPTYTIKRTNNSPTIGVYSRYAISDSAQPTSSATKTNSNSLTYNQTQDISGSAKTVNVKIGGTAEQCFYITYDANVVLIGDDDASAAVGIRNGNEDRDFAGKQKRCFTFTNPVRSYTAHFDNATTVGTLDAHDRLVRTNGNHDGKITNHDRITTGDDDVIGTYEWAWPSSDKYTASFTHTVSRTDDVISDTNNNFYVASAKVNWQIQYQLNNSGVWQNYTASLDDSSSVATSGSFYLTGKNTTNVTGSTSTKPKFTMNMSNVGTHTIHCQRIAYNAETYYETRYDENNLDGHLDHITGYSTTTKYSTPVCVSIKNPNWHESDGDILTHQIDVTGRTNGTEFKTDELAKSGNNYETLVIYPTIFVNHKLTRADSGDDESDAVFSGKFWQKSIYNNDNYKVQTNLSAYEKIIGFDTSASLAGVVAGDNLDGSLKVRLGASSKTNGESFSSTKTKGASKLDFNATGTNKYSVMAGQTKTFTVATNNLPTRWTVKYKKIILKEYYTYGAAADAIETFDRIEKVDDKPKVSSPPAKYTSDAETFTLNRPYNFKITSDTPSVISGSGSIVAFAGDVLSVNYKIGVSKENNNHKYITDPNHTDNARYVYAVTYVLPINTSPSNPQANAATSSGIETSICNHFNAVAKSGSCTILTDTDSSHPNKLTKYAASSVNPNATPSGAVTDTVFRHVYDLNDYFLSYTTSTITVPSNLAVGEKFCIAVAIRNYSSVSNAYYITNSSCRNISKRPTAQVWGGSVITNGGVNTSQSSLNNKIFGSWTDFAVVAGKEIKRMTSGAATISGASASTNLCDRNPLTISNARCNESSNQLGFSAIDARTGFDEKVLHYVTGNTASITDLPNYDASTKTHTIDSGTYIVRTNSDITINRNIIISNQFAARSSTPQVIIIAPNINIESNVTRIDAWLIAVDDDARGGEIDTCSDIDDDDLSSIKCTNRLVVNGALSAATINLKRTYGGDAAEGSLAIPAEIINFSPSILFWSANGATSEANPATTYIRRLPARY